MPGGNELSPMEQKAAIDETAMQRLQQSIEAMSARFEAQLAAQQAQHNAQIALLTQAAKKAAASSITLTTTPYRSTMYPYTQENASASLLLPPVRRQSYGQPQPTANMTPQHTPAAKAGVRSIKEELESGSDEGNQQTAKAEQPRLPHISKEMIEVRKAFLSAVKPYDGKDTDDCVHVHEWCEKVNTEFSVLMGEVQEGRIELVRQRLAGQALVWMNRAITLRESAGEPTEWDDMMPLFIEAHIGENTQRSFEGQLRALRWGNGEGECKSLPDLNKKFDHLAEMAFPNSRWSVEWQRTLGTIYADVVFASKRYVVTSILNNQAPLLLEDWKRCVSDRWAALMELERMHARFPSQSGRGGRGGGKWQTGRGGSAAATPAPSQALNNISGASDDMQGESFTEEGQNDSQSPQLNATSTRGGRGGGRGARGGGGARGGKAGNGVGAPAHWDGEKKKLYDDGRCFKSKEEGHLMRACPQLTSQPSNK
jgi:hypothetical protein